MYIAEAHEHSYIATGLEPYRIYYFTITLCNRVGCVTSEPGMGQTFAAGKKEKNVTAELSAKLARSFLMSTITDDHRLMHSD